MLLVAVGLSVVESVVGPYMSFYSNLASGATIVLVETAVFGLALALSHRPGVLVGRPVG
jgi:ABC-type Mn2+/Zn2+ transport system permease subunit